MRCAKSKLVIKLDDIFLKNSIYFNYFVIVNILGGRTDPSFADDFNQGYVVISFVKICVHTHVHFEKQDFFKIIRVIDVHVHYFYYFAIVFS